MDAQHSQKLHDLEQSFRAFNQVSERLEASYHSLENQVVQLQTVIREDQPPRIVQSNNAANDIDRYRAIIKALPAGVVVINPQGRIEDSNPAAEALLGEPLTGEIWTDVIQRVFAPRSDDGHEISLKDGRRVSISTCPIGDLPGQVLLLTDVTQTRVHQAHVNQHQRLIAMGEMAASLAHQIRTPLSTGLLFSSQLKNASLDDDARNGIVDKVVSQLRHLERLIDDMLMFSRNGYGGEDDISLETLVNGLAEAVTPQCRQRQIDLQVDCQIPSASIKGNTNVLHSALLNLMNNAVQALGQGGVLQLAVRSGVADNVEICVIDNGPGIARDVQEKLFKPFFTTRRDGTGLGLAVVKAVARAHRGSVSVKSTEGQGSEFIVTLPLKKNDQIRATAFSAVGAQF